MRRQPHKDIGKKISMWKKQQVQSPVKGISLSVLGTERSMWLVHDENDKCGGR